MPGAGRFSHLVGTRTAGPKRAAAGDAAAVRFTRHVFTKKLSDSDFTRSIYRVDETKKDYVAIIPAGHANDKKMNDVLSIDELEISVNKGFYVVWVFLGRLQRKSNQTRQDTANR